MTDVFISYKRRMRPQVEEIARRLEELAVEVWFDANLEPGSTFSETIAREVRTAKCVLVCFTNDVFPHGGDENGWVIGEATIGRKRKVLVSALLEPTDLDPPWNTVHVEDLTSLSGGTADPKWRSVVGAIGRHIGRPGLADYQRAIAAGSASLLQKWAEKYPDDPLTPKVHARLAALRELPEEPDPFAPGAALAGVRAGERRRVTGASAVAVTLIAVIATATVMWALGGRGPWPDQDSSSSSQQSSSTSVNDVMSRTDRPPSPSSEASQPILYAPKNNVDAQRTTEDVVRIDEPRSLTQALHENGFTEANAEAVATAFEPIHLEPTLPLGAHLRIFYESAGSPPVPVPVRVSLYVHDDASGTDIHRGSVARLDSGGWRLAIAPAPITFDDEASASASEN